ncbi:MAG: type II secretion system minor pseudopilin GspJ [Moraxellaceae bacterium]
MIPPAILHPERARGFTLLEVLVAIAILALVAVGAYQLLAGTISTRDRGLAHEKALQDLQKAEMLIQRDLLQAVARPVRDEFGDVQPGFYLPQENVMEFTRRGWRNPLQETRSDLLRLRYRVEGQQLIRERWSVLDRSRVSQPEKTVLLDKVEKFQIQVFSDGNWSDAWPALAQIQKDKKNIPLPDAVEIRFTLPPWGEIRRVIALPENDAHASPTPAAPAA